MMDLEISKSEENRCFNDTDDIYVDSSFSHRKRKRKHAKINTLQPNCKRRKIFLEKGIDLKSLMTKINNDDTNLEWQHAIKCGDFLFFDQNTTLIQILKIVSIFYVKPLECSQKIEWKVEISEIRPFKTKTVKLQKGNIVNISRSNQQFPCKIMRIEKKYQYHFINTNHNTLCWGSLPDVKLKRAQYCSPSKHVLSTNIINQTIRYKNENQNKWEQGMVTNINLDDQEIMIYDQSNNTIETRKWCENVIYIPLCSALPSHLITDNNSEEPMDDDFKKECDHRMFWRQIMSK